MVEEEDVGSQQPRSISKARNDEELDTLIVPDGRKAKPVRIAFYGKSNGPPKMMSVDQRTHPNNAKPALAAHVISHPNLFPLAPM